MKNFDADSIGLVLDRSTTQYRSNNDQRLSSFSTNYETTETPRVSFVSRHAIAPFPVPPRPPFNKPFLQDSQDDLDA